MLKTTPHQRTVTLQKAVATLQGNPALCPHRACRKRKQCTGGPRGTFKRYGKPLCKIRKIAAFIAGQAKWIKAARHSRAREREDWAAFNAYNADP